MSCPGCSSKKQLDLREGNPYVGKDHHVENSFYLTLEFLCDSCGLNYKLLFKNRFNEDDFSKIVQYP